MISVGGAIAAIRVGVSAIPRIRSYVQDAGDAKFTWVETVGPSGQLVSLTADESADFDTFVSSAEVGALLQMNYLIRLIGQQSTQDQKTLQAAFRNLCEKWCRSSGRKWSKQANEIWLVLNSNFSKLLPGAEAVAGIEPQLEEVENYLDSPLLQKKMPHALGVLLGAASNPGALAAVAELGDFLSGLALSLSAPPIFSHLESERAIPFDSLYVDRLLTIDDKDLPTSEIFDEGRPFRGVLLGVPGAGKTTLVTHLTRPRELHSTPLPPVIVVKCREYAAKSWSNSISQYVASKIASDFDYVVTADTVRLALALGKMALVFDGLDEVPNLARRIELTKRIEAHALLNPFASVLVTSRKEGYSKSPLPEELFDTFSLQEFNDAQIQQYAEKWFAQMERADLTAIFLAEASTVNDLTKNPLLLSLLCSLYKANGAIPRNRRSVYAKCADLLFYKWDAARQIEQHEDLPDFGVRIMEEIARFFYTSATAQNGVEQEQLSGIVGVFMADYAGVDRDAARARAASFIEFCSGRAWLLAKVGVGRTGEALFGFTHRTFYEFFAAESLARMSADPSEIASHILRAFRADQTSVLPELLIQAFEEKQFRGASLAFTAVLQNSNGEGSLWLRLMNTNLRRDVRVTGFNKLALRWKGRLVEPPIPPGGKKKSKSAEPRWEYRLPEFGEVASLLDLHHDPRQQFISDFLLSDAFADLPVSFLNGWACIQRNAFGVSRPHSREWDEAARELVAPRVASEWSDRVGSLPIAVKNELIVQGLVSPELLTLEQLISFEGYAGNYALGAAISAFSGGMQSGAGQMAEFLGEVWRSTRRVRRGDVSISLSHILAQNVVEHLLEQPETEAIIGLLCVAIEYPESSWNGRRGALLGAIGVDALLAAEERIDWLQEWLAGKYRLTQA